MVVVVRLAVPPSLSEAVHFIVPGSQSCTTTCLVPVTDLSWHHRHIGNLPACDRHDSPPRFRGPAGSPNARATSLSESSTSAVLAEREGAQ